MTFGEKTQRKEAKQARKLILSLGVLALLVIFQNGVSLFVNSNKAYAEDWHITFDPDDDGCDATGCGLLNSSFDYHGLGIKQSADGFTYVAISSNIPNGPGVPESRATDKFVNHGDVLINIECANTSLFDMSQSAKLYGVRFVTNNSGVGAFGVYRNVMAMESAGNANIAMLERYFDLVEPDAPEGFPSQGGFSEADMEVQRGLGTIETVIKAGEQISDPTTFMTLTALELGAAGLNLALFGENGSYNITGFKYQTSLIPQSDKTCYHLGAECGNDFVGQMRVIPELPTTILPGFFLAMSGLILFLRKSLV